MQSFLPQPLAVPARHLRCQLCANAMSSKDGDDLELGACARCVATRPAKVEELRRRAGSKAGATAGPGQEFNEAEKALITRLGGLTPLPKLLQLINDRRQADRPGCTPFTLQQLQDEHDRITGRPKDSGWVVMRRLLQDARKTGVLQKVTAEVIDDFAIVYQLTRGQVLHLKDVLLGDGEED